MKHIETNIRPHIHLNLFKYRIEYTIGHKISYTRKKIWDYAFIKEKTNKNQCFFQNQETYRDERKTNYTIK